MGGFKEGGFDVTLHEQELDKAMEGKNFQPRLAKIEATVKSVHSRGTLQQKTLNELTWDIWNQYIESILEHE